MWGMGLINHILWVVIGGVFIQQPQKLEINNIQVKVIKYNQGIRLIKLDQRIELIESNQWMGLIKSNLNIQSWQIVRCSIMIDGKTPNCDRQDTQLCWVHLRILYEA